MNNLKQTIEDLISQSKYEQAAQTVAKAFNLEMKAVSHKIDEMWGDKQLRRIFTMCLIRGQESYTFDFGQSVVNSFKKSKTSVFETDKEVVLKMGLEGGEKQLHLEIKTTTKLLRQYETNKQYFLNKVVEDSYLSKLIQEANEKISNEDKKKPTWARRKLFGFKGVQSHLILLIDNQINKLKNEFIEEVIKEVIEPTMYDVLACLQKYDVGSFEDFCGNFGYDEDSRQAEKTYKAVLKEFEAMERLFTNEELEILAEIN